MLLVCLVSSQTFAFAASSGSKTASTVELQGYITEATDQATSAEKTTTVNINQLTPIWWFNNANPANYPVRVQLIIEGTVPPPGAWIKWEIFRGPQKANFNNNADVIEGVDLQTVFLHSTDYSRSRNDVGVRFYINGQASQPAYVTIKTSNRLVFQRNYHLNDPAYGYSSYIKYRVEDQFNHILPYAIEWGEEFTTVGISDYRDPVTGQPVATNWRGGMGVTQAGSLTMAPNALTDHVQGETLNAGFVPAPQSPHTPLIYTKVQHWDGKWRCGSLVIGLGKVVKNDNRWKKYRDHAEHNQAQ